MLRVALPQVGDNTRFAQLRRFLHHVCNIHRYPPEPNPRLDKTGSSRARSGGSKSGSSVPEFHVLMHARTDWAGGLLHSSPGPSFASARLLSRHRMVWSLLRPRSGRAPPWRGPLHWM